MNVGFYSVVRIFVDFSFFFLSLLKQTEELKRDRNMREKLQENEEKKKTTAANHRSRSNVEKRLCQCWHTHKNRRQRPAIPPNQMYKCWVLIYLTENINLHNAVWRSTCACEYECSHARSQRYMWIFSWMMAMMTIFKFIWKCTTKQVAPLDSPRLDALAWIRRKIAELWRRILWCRRCWANLCILTCCK